MNRSIAPLHAAVLSAATAEQPEEVWEAFARATTICSIGAMDDHALDLLPLVFWRAKTLGNEAGSPEVSPYYKRTWIKNQQLLFSVQPLLDELTSRDIPFVVLKGFAMMSSQFYDDLGARYAADIDLLIRLEDIDTVRQVGAQIGWTGPDDDETALRTKWSHALAMETDAGVEVDVHWELLSRSWHPTHTASLLRNPVVARVDSRTIPVPDRTRQLLHSLAHVKPEGYRNIADAILIVRDHRDSIDWDAFVNEIVDRRVIGAVLHSLRLIDEVAADLLPARVRSQLTATRRHWSDIEYAPTTSRLQAVKVFLSLAAHRSRWARPYQRPFMALRHVVVMGSRFDRDWRQKIVDMAFRGPTGQYESTAP